MASSNKNGSVEIRDDGTNVTFLVDGSGKWVINKTNGSFSIGNTAGKGTATAYASSVSATSYYQDGSKLQFFPFGDLVTVPWNSAQQDLRYMVHPTLGNDTNHGKSWLKPKKTFQGVIDALPVDLLGHEVKVFAVGGSYPSFNFANVKNGLISFEWIGTWVYPAADGSNRESWMTYGATANPASDNSAIVITATGTDSAISIPNLNIPTNLSFSTYAFDSDYSVKWGRFKARTTGTPTYLVHLLNMDSVTFLGWEFDLGDTTVAGMNLANNYSTDLKYIGVTGGNGGASLSDVRYGSGFGAAFIISSFEGIGRFNNDIYDIACNDRPFGSNLVFKAFRNVLGYINDPTTYEDHKFYFDTTNYNHGSLTSLTGSASAALPNIYLGEHTGGFFQYNPASYYLYDSSSASRVIQTTAGASSAYAFGLRVEAKPTTQSINLNANNTSGTACTLNTLVGKISVSGVNVSAGTPFTLTCSNSYVTSDSIITTGIETVGNMWNESIISKSASSVIFGINNLDLISGKTTPFTLDFRVHNN